MRRSMLVLQVSPGPRRADALDVLVDAAAAVLDHALGAVLARERAVEGQLEALLADVVDVGEAEQVRRSLRRSGRSAGIRAAKLTPGMLELAHRAGLGRARGGARRTGTRGRGCW